jgi:hypothetical protein
MDASINSRTMPGKIFNQINGLNLTLAHNLSGFADKKSAVAHKPNEIMGAQRLQTPTIPRCQRQLLKLADSI